VIANSERPLGVLFLCTGNSARSIMAEALLNGAGQGRFLAYSAGSYPTGAVNPYALAALDEQGVPKANARSKSWDEFAQSGASPIDIVITVCDNAASEVCPVWPGHPITAHWGVPDPATVQGDDATKRAAFRRTLSTLQHRIDLLLAVPRSALEQRTAGLTLREIGKATP
jgi:arsenate reductase (thioredoxin)